MSDWQTLILPALAAFVLLYYLVPLGRMVQASMRSRTWPQVQGKIMTSKASKSRSANPLSMRYEFVLEYTYTISGHHYTSSVISFGDAALNRLNFRLRTRRAAVKIAQQFPANTPVTVYYDPQNPAQAVLRPGLQTNEIMLTLVTLLIPLILFVLVVVIN